MPVYTWNPVPTFEARQINSQEDGDAWVASLTDNELRNDNDIIAFTNVRVEVDVPNGQFILRYTRTDEADGAYAINCQPVPLGGYVLANRDNLALNLWAEDETNFNRRFQPYPVQP